MANNKNKSTLWSSLTRFLVLIPGSIDLARRFIVLIEHEARIAGRSLIHILGLCIAMITLLSISWLCVLSILFLLLLDYMQLNPLTIFAILLFINITLVAIVYRLISNQTKKLTFPITRDIISKK